MALSCYNMNMYKLEEEYNIIQRRRKIAFNILFAILIFVMIALIRDIIGKGLIVN